MLYVSFLAMLMPLVASPTAPAAMERREVQCDIRLASTALKPGATGEILLVFSPEEGIHINTDPAMEIQLDKSSPVHFSGITSIPKMPKTGYLAPGKPVRCSFTVNKSAKKGKHVIKGTVQYYFCSDAEGWCNRSSQPIELTFTVAP